MKYIIYCRKSTDTEDKQLLSLDAQERELLELAEKHGLEVVKIMRESMSAKSVGRPVFNEMMKLVENKKADAVLCWKLDRLARNFVDGGKVIDSLQRGVIQEIRTYESTHLPSDNVLLLAVQLGMANQYVRDLSVNVKRGNREKLARGEWPNHAPFGYINDKATKKIFVDEQNKKYIVRAYELCANERKNLREISDILYAEGLRSSSGKKVFKSLVHRIVTNPFYMGVMTREGKFYDGKHEPIISKQLFDRAQDVLNGRLHPKSKTLFFPLRGFISCDNCGCALTASLKKGHQYYYCTNGKRICDEHKSYLRENDLYEHVAKMLGDLAFTPRKIELMYQAAKERTSSQNDYSEKIVQTLTEQLNGLKVRESKLLDAYIAEQISKELYDSKVLELHNVGVSLKKQIKEAESRQPASTLEPIKKLFMQGSTSQKEFLDGDDAKKHEVIKKLLWNFSMKDKTVASIKYKSPFQVIANAPKNATISQMLPDLDSNQDDNFQRVAPIVRFLFKAAGLGFEPR